MRLNDIEINSADVAILHNGKWYRLCDILNGISESKSVQEIAENLGEEMARIEGEIDERLKDIEERLGALK